jgi:hypothetical protein
MGKLTNCCTAPTITDLPGAYVEALFMNTIDHGATERRISNTRRLRRRAGANFEILDSSGFSLLRAEEKGAELSFDCTKPIKRTRKAINLGPKHVVEVASILRPNEFVALDLPLRRLPNPTERDEEFKFKLQFNVRWAIETAKLREMYCPEVGLLLAVQCYTLEQLDLFLEAIKDVRYDGISMPIRNANLADVAMFMFRFWQAGIRRVHLLGATAFLTLALCAYMSRHFFNLVSMDSRTWKIQADHNIYMNPHDLSKMWITRDTVIDGDIQMDCNCGWCKDRTFTYVKHLPYSDRRLFLCCHNYWAIENACRELYKHSASIQGLELYLRAHCKKGRWKKIDELITVLSMIDILKDENSKYLEALLIGQHHK